MQRVYLLTCELMIVAVAWALGPSSLRATPQDTFEVNDSHFHLTNYVQEGTSIRDFVQIMGKKVGRAAIFGIPLQQQWSYGNTGNFAPTYYLQTDAPLYYYSFTDASIAMAYRSLPPADRALSDPSLGHVHVDLSWDETAKYIVSSPETIAVTADAINRHPDRFLFGTDEVAPSDQQRYLKTYQMYAPLFARLTPSASEQVRKGNYLRLFDEARRRVRAWEKVHAKEDAR